MNSLQRWIRDYENRRHSGQSNRLTKESWISSKYDTQSMDWRELQQLYLPEIGMCWGPACNSLKKLWKSYKIAGRTGEPRSDIAWNIRNLQRSMGIQETYFEELQGMDDEEDELELRKEERIENGEDWGNPWTSPQYTSDGEEQESDSGWL